MAELPFCPFPKPSSTSSTSVLCRCLISVASLSNELAINENTLNSSACRSRGIICVDTGSIENFNFLATIFSTLWSILE